MAPPVAFTAQSTVLFVGDLKAEVAFYEKLGWDVVFEGEAFSGFVTLAQGDLCFGLQLSESFSALDAEAIDEMVWWQFQVEDLRPVLALAGQEGWEITEPTCYWPEQDAWEMSVFTPNGYRLRLEGPNPTEG